jgi:hypothetical protein
MVRVRRWMRRTRMRRELMTVGTLSPAPPLPGRPRREGLQEAEAGGDDPVAAGAVVAGEEVAVEVVVAAAVAVAAEAVAAGAGATCVRC